MYKNKLFAIAAIVTILGAGVAQAAMPEDSMCVAKFRNCEGILTIKDGKPVRYRTTCGYKASNTSLVGTTIRIDKATYKMSMTSTKKRLVGTWRLGDYPPSKVVFICR